MFIHTEIFKRCVDEVAHNLTRQDSLLLADKLGIRKAAIERSKQESSDFECTKRLLMNWCVSQYDKVMQSGCYI